ncbi:ATP-binding protein [Streptomyces sp. NPDC089799]|uniref:sensor histidine kinase n=1 Tax=Streptomyces sp. NPDC089799 TaxID=3155066 RepID=UPI00342E0F29
MPRSERGRLTALCGSLLVLAGGGLVVLVNVLLRKGLFASINGALATTVALPGSGDGLRDGLREGLKAAVPAERMVPAGRAADFSPEQLEQYRITQPLSLAAERATLHNLLIVSLAALAVFAVLSVWLAWWMAGRVLRPVGVITETARRLSGENLHERIGLQAPPGELKRLADTFDGMLDRMEHLVSAQRRFAANAAHELRTPLAVQRSAAEIGLAGDPPPEKVARIRAKLIDTAAASEHLIESLLLLAVSEEGPSATEEVDLAELTDAAADGLAEAGGREADSAPRPTVRRDLAPLPVTGDRQLLGHLVGNLLGNAVRHNRPGGRITLSTSATGLLTVSNTGAVIAPAEVPALLEPFRRRAERRHLPGEGAGLGLSIVASIARAHGAELSAEANPAPGGGLTVRVRFPAASPRPGSAARSAPRSAPPLA